MRLLGIGRLGATIVSVLMLIGVVDEFALGQSLAWAKRAGGTNFDQGESIAVDSAGNSYVTGWFTGSATFGPGEANETSLTSTGSDVFVAKYGGNGALLWVRQASGPPETRGEAIAVDGAGNSYVTGFFRFGITFHNGAMLPGFASGEGDLFVAKYDGNGNLVWARRAGEDFIPGVVDVGKHGRGISADSAGNSYVTGHFGTELGESSIFVAKYDANGALLWVKHASNDGVNPSFASGSSISVDGAGNGYASGDFYGAITFGPGEASQITLTSGTGFDQRRNLFVAKYDSSGILLWARQAGGAETFIEGQSISVDSTGNSHVTGRFSGNAIFGLGQLNETTLMGVNLQDIFVAKYDTSGALVWAKQASGPGHDWGMAISVDSAGNSHVTGGFEVSVTFGPGESNETTLTNAVPTTGGPPDIFIAKYASNGVLLSAKQAGGIGREEGRGISVDSVGSSYVTGGFGGSATFGQGEANETTLASAADSLDIFMAKYQNDSAPPPANRAPLANAGPDQMVNVGATTQLNGSGSSDSDGDPLTYNWSFVSRPAGSVAVISDSAAIMPTFVADLPGAYVAQLIVNDGQVNSEPDTVTITTNSPPVANAGPDQAVNIGATVRLNGSGSSDPDADPLTYNWSFSSRPAGSAAVLSNPTTVSPSFVPDLAGTYDLQLIVSDSKLNSLPDTVTITATSSGSTIGCGELRSGTIVAAGEVDLYSFSGQTGQIISLALASTEGFSPNPGSNANVALTLFAPSGAAVGVMRSNSQANFRLPETGVYVIRVSAFNLGTTGSYNLNFECLLPNQSPDTVDLPCGALRSGTIVAVGEVDLYSFSGQTGQIILLALASTGGFSPNPGSNANVALTLFAPSGVAVGVMRSNSQANFRLPETGVYVIRVSAFNLGTTGSYNLNFECLLPNQSPDTVDLPCGALRSGTIVAVGEVDLYSFSGQTGQIISLALASTGGFSPNPGSNANVALTLFAPSGVAVAVMRSNSQANFRLPEAGVYVIRVSAFNLSKTGSYDLRRDCR